MSKPIIVGYDPADRRPRAGQLRASRAARFTGAPLIVASVSAASDRPGRRADGRGPRPRCARARSREAERELDAKGSRSSSASSSTSAARALHEAAEAQDAGLLVVGSTGRGSAACFPAPRRSASCTARRARSRLSRTVGRQATGCHDRRRVRRHRRGPRGAARRSCAGPALGRDAARPPVVKAGAGARTARPRRARAEQRGKDFDEVEGEQRVRAEDGTSARDRSARRRRPGGDRCLRRGSRRRPDPRV